MALHDESADDLQKLVYGISHDLGAPMRTVVQFSNLLVQSLADRLTEKEQYWLQLIRDGGIQGQQMIEALKVYSRLVTQPHEASVFSLQQLTDETIIKIQKLFPQQKNDIEITSRLPDIFASREYWRVILSELIKNAVLFQPKDDEHQVHVVIAYQLTDGDIAVSVEDNGLGVAEQQWSAITVPFKRLQRKDEYPGLGMGLCYCDRIAQLLNGRLTFGHSGLGGLAVTFAHSFVEHPQSSVRGKS